jgi:hypothetical protein
VAEIFWSTALETTAWQLELSGLVKRARARQGCLFVILHRLHALSAFKTHSFLQHRCAPAHDLLEEEATWLDNAMVCWYPLLLFAYLTLLQQTSNSRNNVVLFTHIPLHCTDRISGTCGGDLHRKV